MKDKHLRPWLSVIVGGESLVSHAGGALLVETARRSGLTKEELSSRLGPWRRPFAIHDPGKIVGLDAVICAASSSGVCGRSSRRITSPLTRVLFTSSTYDVTRCWESRLPW